MSLRALARNATDSPGYAGPDAEVHIVDNSGFEFKLQQWQLNTAVVAVESTPLAVEAALRVYVNTYRDYGASGEDAAERGAALLTDFVSHCLMEKAAPVQVSHAALVPAAPLSAGVASSPDVDVRTTAPPSCVKLESPPRTAAACDPIFHASQVMMTPEQPTPPALEPKVEAPSPSASDVSAAGAGIHALLSELRCRPDADPTRGLKPVTEKQRSFMKQLNVPPDVIDRVTDSSWASIIIDEQLSRKKAGKAALAIDTRNPQ